MDASPEDSSILQTNTIYHLPSDVIGLLLDQVTPSAYFCFIHVCKWFHIKKKLPQKDEIIRDSLTFNTPNVFIFLRDDMKINIRNTHVCQTIARFGSIELLGWAHNNGYIWNEETYVSATLEGRLDVVKYLHENGCPWNKDVFIGAATQGHLEIFKYFHQNGCSWNEWTCSEAAKGGHLEILKYIYENSCFWDNIVSQVVSMIAAVKGHF